MVLQHIGIGIAGLDVLLQPLGIGLVLREGSDEFLAWHVRLIDTDVHDHALVLADAINQSTHAVLQFIDHARDQFELHELIDHFRACFFALFVVRAIFGYGRGVFLVQLADPVHALARFFRIRAGIHCFFSRIAIALFIIIVIL